MRKWPAFGFRRHVAASDAPLPTDSTGEPDPVGVRAQLDCMLGSKDFEATERLRKFLSYVVEESLAGRADRIKAYSIAIEVFGRDSSFDANSDPIVRVEAGHLRRALDRYYLSAGSSDEIVITIPKGSYVPKFEARPRQPVGPTATRRPASLRVVSLAIASLCGVVALSWLTMDRMNSESAQAPALPRLLVRPFEDATNAGNAQAIARGLTREIIGQIAKFKDIVTIEGGSGGDAKLAPGDPRYALVGDIDMTDDGFRLRARVLNRADNSVIWANSYDGDLQASKLIAIETDIARQVATTLGQPYGVIYQADASQRPERAPDDWQAYACTLSYYAYRASLDAKTHPLVRQCLEDAVRRFPTYATAWALLSQTYVDEIRFRYPIEPSSTPASIDRALEAARRAVELDPQNIRALQAEMFALYFHGEHEAALRIGEKAFAINPNDSELLGEYGYRLALSGNWSRGCDLIEKAVVRNPAPSAYYETALAVCSYFKGDLRAAEMWVNRTPTPENPNYHMIAAAIYGEAGKTAEAARERDWLLAHAPRLVANLRSELALRVVRPEDVEHVMRSLRKAGVVPPSEDRVSTN